MNTIPASWLLRSLVTIVALVALRLSAGEVSPIRGKKLIEHGWDVPTPSQMREQLGAMEKRPLDGLIFRLAGGHNAFLTKPLDPAKFIDDERILPDLPFTKFRDNFVLVWGSPPADFDWFNDRPWDIIEANAKGLAKVAQAGRERGICFDPEPYDFSLWHYARQPGTNDHTFAEYRSRIRKRGAQLMRAFEHSMRGATTLTFFHVSLFDRFANLPEDERARDWNETPEG